ncbi:MAG: isoamylase early set domain-containing protein [Gemmatimonadaceae bacterium]
MELIAREARRPVQTDPAARARIMAAVRAEAVPRRRSSVRDLWERVVAPRSLTFSPMTGSLLAAGLVGIGVLAGALTSNRVGRSSAGQSQTVAPGLPVALQASDTVVKFVLLAPNAGKVSLVGDFNDWDESRSPMVRAEKGGLWSVTLPLPVGRHVYAYVVDGTTWLADPKEPMTGDGFGHMNSVKVVTKGSTL